MISAAKIERQQKAFLKAMKEKFAEDPTATTRPGLQENVNSGVPLEPVTHKIIACPICRGRGYHGLKRARCHSCRGTGERRVRA